MIQIDSVTINLVLDDDGTERIQVHHRNDMSLTTLVGMLEQAKMEVYLVNRVSGA